MRRYLSSDPDQAEPIRGIPAAAVKGALRGEARRGREKAPEEPCARNEDDAAKTGANDLQLEQSEEQDENMEWRRAGGDKPPEPASSDQDDVGN